MKNKELRAIGTREIRMTKSNFEIEVQGDGMCRVNYFVEVVWRSGVGVG
jgi:hypothetical protein